MTFSKFELIILDDAWRQMSEESVQNRLSVFRELRKTSISNERWFEWELYYRLLRVERGWNREKREKGNRKKENIQIGDGVDLQFANGHFIELRTITTEKTNMGWVIKGLRDHPDANAVLFLALYHKNLRKWLEKHRTRDKKFHFRGLDFEMKIRHINEDWIVGIVKSFLT